MPLPERPYQPQVDPTGAADFAPASPEAFGAGVGRAVEQLGGTLERLKRQQEEIDQQRQYDQDAAQASVDLSQFGADMDAEEARAKEGAQPGGAGHTEGLLKSFDERKAKLPFVTDERLRLRRDAQLADMRGRLEGAGQLYESGARVNRIVTLEQQRRQVAGVRAFQSQDPKVLHEELQNLDNARLDWVDRMPVDAANKLHLEGVHDLWNNFIRGLAPQEAKTYLDSGQVEVSDDQFRALREKNNDDLHGLAIDARQQVNADKADAKDRMAFITTRANDGVPIPEADIKQAEADLQRPEFGFNDSDAYTLETARTKDRVTRKYANAFPATIDAQIKHNDALIANLPEGDPQQHGLRLERDQLAAMLPKRQAEIEKDPLAFYARSGGTLTAIDPNDPATYGQRLAEAKKANRLTGGPLNVLTDTEASSFEQLWSSDKPERRIALVNNLASAPEFGRAVAEKIAPHDKDLAVLVSLAAMDSAGQQTARDAIQGDAAIAANKNIIREKSAQEVFDADGPALEGFEPHVRQAIQKLALRYFATRQQRAGQLEWTEQNDAYSRSRLHLALGAVLGERWVNPKETSGGFGRHSGRSIILPVGVTQDKFNDLIANATPTDFHVASGRTHPVDASGRTPSLPELKSLQYRAVGDGIYQALVQGGVLMQRENPGEPYEFDARKLHSYARPH